MRILVTDSTHPILHNLLRQAGHKVTEDTTLNYDAGNETLFLEITSLSRDTYLYTVTKEDQRGGSSIMGFLSEPVRIHSNVKGGLGILGAKASINLQLDINTSDTTTGR